MAITIDDFLVLCNRTLDGMVEVVGALDDAQINTRPPLPGASSIFQLGTHALGAFEWWTGHMVCHEPSDRRREEEFEASGTAAELVAAAETTRARLHRWAPALAKATSVAEPPHTQQPLDGEWTVGTALLHAYEELAQHLGHIEITADLLGRRDDEPSPAAGFAPGAPPTSGGSLSRGPRPE